MARNISPPSSINITTNNDARIGTNMIPKLAKNKPRPIIARIVPIFFRRIFNAIFSILFFLVEYLGLKGSRQNSTLTLNQKTLQDKSDIHHERTNSRGSKVSKLAVYDERNLQSQPQCRTEDPLMKRTCWTPTSSLFRSQRHW